MSVDGLKLGKIAAAAFTLVLATAAVSAPASAHDDRGRYRHHDRHVEYRYAPPPRYYAPPPRVIYVEPRPAYYYAPPPYYPPVVSFGFVFGR